MKLKEWIETAVAFIVILGFAWGGLHYFAKAEDLHLVELRLDQKIVFDQVMDAKKQMWTIEERNKDKKAISDWDQRDREEYRRLQSSLEELQKRRDILLKK